MTNRSASKQHGLVGNNRPVKAAYKKRNKAKARARRLAKQEEMMATKKPATKKASPKKAETPSTEKKES